MKVSTYHTVRLTYNWKNIQKKKDGIKWSPEILLVTAVLLKWPTEIDLGLRAGRGGVCMCVIFFFISKPSWCCEYMRDVWQTRTWFVELWKANIVSFGHFFLVVARCCLQMCVPWAMIEWRKNSGKSFGLFPFSLCSRSPHANDGFQFAFAGEKMAFPMRRLGSYDGMWHAYTAQQPALWNGMFAVSWRRRWPAGWFIRHEIAVVIGNWDRATCRYTADLSRVSIELKAEVCIM